MLIPVSRSISRADDPGLEAERIRAMINTNRSELKVQKHLQKDHLPDLKGQIANRLYEIGSIKFGEFTLKSGKVSPIYIDLRRLIAFPDLLSKVAKAYQAMITDLEFDHLAALPYAAIPITTAVSLQGGWSMIYPRKEDKEYGTKAQVEGVYKSGEVAVVIDDLITTGGSKLEGIQKLAGKGLEVKHIVVLIDRSRNAAKFLSGEGFILHSFLTITELLNHYQKAGLVDEHTAASVLDFINEDE
jgi:uridine monophosphate synthetase